jgi:hypothetical protein
MIPSQKLQVRTAELNLAAKR